MVTTSSTLQQLIEDRTDHWIGELIRLCRQPSVSADDKGHLVSRFAALEAFRALHPDTPFRIKFLFEGEEEIGSPSLEPFIRDHAELLAAEACIWEGGGVDDDNRPVIFCGLRGC